MGTTSPDGIPYPSDYNLAADVPNAMQANSNAVQTALNKKAKQTDLTATNTEVAKKANAALVTATLTQHGNFQGSDNSVAKMGQLVHARGLFTRKTSLTVTDNTEYQFAIIPDGFRPAATVTASGAWLCLNTGPNPDVAAYMATTIIAKPNGDLCFIANVNGTMRIGGDYVSAGGLSWWTA